MRRDEVPEQHAVLEPELGQRSLHDRRRRLRRPVTGELALGRERDPRDACAAVAGRLADEQDAGFTPFSEVPLQPRAPKLGVRVLVEGGADPRGCEPLDEARRHRALA
jgi:hypothetical protein